MVASLIGTAAVDFRILGPLEVWRGAERLPCEGAKQRLLLAVLLMNAGEVVSTDRLIDALWGEQPPARPIKALQMRVVAVRKLLAAGDDDLLVTRAAGYALRVGEDQLDLHRFEATVREAHSAAAMGRAAETARLLHDALAIWRGPPLADLAFEPALQLDVSRLEELHLATLEERLDADLAAGRHAAVIGELEGLVLQHPLRERLRGQLMVALYRAGRQAEALAIYRDARKALVEELGLEPTRELRDLERRILAQDPALAPPTTWTGVAAPGWRAPRGFVGRERELAALLPVVDRALAGDGGVLLIGGEPGIGKSRLADVLAGRISARAEILVGRCWEAGGAPPYWPWVQALRGWVQAREPADLRRELGASAPDLRTILPELGEALPDVASVPRPDSEGARFRLLEAVASVLRASAAARPVAVFLDDLHAADAPSILLLRFIATQLGGVPLLVVGCYRDTEAGPELEAALADLAREPTVHRLALGGLDAQDTAALLESALGRPAGDLAERVHDGTRGNPLFAAEIGRLLAADGAAAMTGEALPIPRGVREAIARRLSRQSERCREVLTRASIVGREFTVEVVGRLSGLAEDELFDALDEAAAARLVELVPGGGGRLRFSHMLMRDALYDAVPATRRMRLHRAAGEALEFVYADAAGGHLAELAHHFTQAGTMAAAKALDYSIRAAERAAAQHAYEEAAVNYAQALRLLDDAGGDASRRVDLLLAEADALSRGGRSGESKRALLAAADLGERIGRPEAVARAALTFGGRFAWVRASADPRFVPLLERALAVTGSGDTSVRAQLLARLASALRDEPRRERRLALADEALGLARAADDARTLATTLAGCAIAMEGPDTAEMPLDMGGELVALGEQLHDRERIYQGRDQRLNGLWIHADRDGIDRELAAMTVDAEVLRQPSQRWHLGTCRTVLALAEGRFEEAEALLASTLEAGRSSESWNALVSHRLARFVLRRAQGRLSESEEDVRRAVEEFPALLRFSCALAHLQAEIGDHGAAAASLDALLARDLAHEHLDAEWLFSICLLPDVCRVLEDGVRAAPVAQLLRPYAALYAIAPTEASFGSVARGLGVLATVAGDVDDAHRHFVRALDTERRMRARPWMAETQLRLAELLERRGEPGDAVRADELRREAAAAFHSLGMATWAARAEAVPGGSRSTC